MPKLLPGCLAAILIIAASAALAAPRSDSADANVRESQQYEQLLCTNAAFRNKRIDEILIGAKHVEKEVDHAAAWKEFQAILQQEQPCTFLYWMNDLVAVNRRIHGTSIGILGITNRAGEWYVGRETARAGL